MQEQEKQEEKQEEEKQEEQEQEEQEQELTVPLLGPAGKTDVLRAFIIPARTATI